jgi:predicted outer membrane protein
LRKSNGIAGKRTLPRLGKGRLLLVLAAAAAVVAAFAVIMNPVGVPASGAANLGGTVNTRWGRLSTLDRQLLVKVRQAGLWEMPAGQQAAQRASSPRVKQVGEIIMRQHMQLDADTRAEAQKLGVLLPNEPNGSQKSWLREMSGKYGADYDKTFVLRLRAAHGQVFTVIAKVRAQTENTEIRAFAERCLKFVNTHMSLLESTGLVPRRALH